MNIVTTAFSSTSTLSLSSYDLSLVQSFWISNTIYLPSISLDQVQNLIQALTSSSSSSWNNSESVLMLREQVVATHYTAFPEEEKMKEGRNTNKSASSSSLSWGLETLEVKSIWKKGWKGQGVVVATIDTGVDGSHPLLAPNFVKDGHGWYDPHASQSALPIDTNGHGTHLLGTICASSVSSSSNGVAMAVAPETQWRTCRGCARYQCPESALLACGQYVVCPTTPDGKDADCALTPQIVVNAWGRRRQRNGGDGHEETFYASTIHTWRAVGIIPIFATGNSGPQCQSIGTPADRPDVLAVAASTRQDGLADFSSVGPISTLGGENVIKPQVVAPGKEVVSTWIQSLNQGDGGDNSVRTMSGTSVAAAHVAGVVALLLSAHPDLEYDEVVNQLTKSCRTHNVVTPGRHCGGVDDSTFPNYMMGYGLVQATAREE